MHHVGHWLCRLIHQCNQVDGALTDLCFLLEIATSSGSGLVEMSSCISLCIMMPLVLSVVPLPDKVSSPKSILSQTNVVNCPCLMMPLVVREAEGILLTFSRD